MLNNMASNNRYRPYGGEISHNNTNLTRLPGNKAAVAMNIPPIDQITGESVMPSDSLLVPLVPAPKPEPRKNPQFSQGYLKEHIGQTMRVEFLIGSDGALIDRIGTLVEVGEDFIVLQPTGTDDLLMCDLFSIKFATISR